MGEGRVMDFLTWFIVVVGFVLCVALVFLGCEDWIKERKVMDDPLRQLKEELRTSRDEYVSVRPLDLLFWIESGDACAGRSAKCPAICCPMR